MFHIVYHVPAAGPPLHLAPTAELSERVLLPGDPHRALAVAQAVLDEPRMFNHRRGLWGYTGRAPDGQAVTVQSTGMGGPSAAIVVEELVSLGARRLIRIGTCGALRPDVALGELIAASEVIAGDGASRALGARGTVRPDPALTAALVAAGARSGVVASTDLFYEAEMPARTECGDHALAVEMEAAAVLRVAELRGARAACVLGVSDLVPGLSGLRSPRRRLDDQQLEQLGIRLGRVAVAALSA